MIENPSIFDKIQGLELFAKMLLGKNTPISSEFERLEEQRNKDRKELNKIREERSKEQKAKSKPIPGTEKEMPHPYNDDGFVFNPHENRYVKPQPNRVTIRQEDLDRIKNEPIGSPVMFGNDIFIRGEGKDQTRLNSKSFEGIVSIDPKNGIQIEPRGASVGVFIKKAGSEGWMPLHNEIPPALTNKKNYKGDPTIWHYVND